MDVALSDDGSVGDDGGPTVVTHAVVDPDDARVADYRGLRTRSQRAGGVPPTTVVVEGPLVVARLLRSGLAVRSILVSPRGARVLAEDLGGATAPIFLAEPEVLRAIVGFDLHRGAIAIAERPPPRSVASVVDGARAVAVLEDVNDHENLGAVARSAAGLGMDALLLSPGCADPLYRRAVRVSMGHVLALPLARVEPWPADLAALRDDGWTVVALTPDAGAVPIGSVDAADLGRVAVVLGAEGAGLSPEALALADLRVRIPMADGIDSLNVAHAAAIAFHRLGRAAGRPG